MRYNRIEQKSRILFYVALTISLLSKLYWYSIWPGCEYGNKIAFVGLIILLPRIITILYCMPCRRSVALIVLFPIVLITCFKTIENTYVLYPFLFSIAAWNIKFRNIIKLFFWINAIFLSVTLLASSIGIIENQNFGRFELDLVNIERGSEYKDRYCFGYNWPTAFAAHVTYLYVMLLFLRNGILKFIDYVAIILSIIFVTKFCDARAEMICMSLVVLVSIYYKFKICKYNNISSFESKILTYIVPICAFLMIYFTYQYEKSENDIFSLINIVSSNRLKYGADALFSYGIKLFGQEYEQRGGTSYDYNFIDCSYLVWLIIYGFFFFTLAIFAFVAICRESVSTKEYLIALCIAIIAIEGSIVSVFLTFSYNPFFMALFAQQSPRTSKKIQSCL